jgi:hypothetical protein
MPFFLGRATSGVRSFLRTAFVGVAAILSLNGCGNDRFTYGTPLITFSATPGPFTAYLVEVDGIVLTRSDNTPAYPLLQPQIVDFTKLNDMGEVFGTPAVLEGTYTSASITVNYAANVNQPGGALLYMDVNGTSTQVAPIDTAGKGAAATSVTYTVKFDPNHPLVIKHGVSTPIDFNFDLSAASIVNKTTSPYQVTVRPFISASTVPNYTKPLRTRGIYVATDTSASNFTINTRPFFDNRGSPVGAIGIQTNDRTVYNINGTVYQGATGLAAVSKLQNNTTLQAYGSIGDLNNAKPTFVATQVFAGLAIDNPLTDRITGTVASRSGTTLHIKGAEVEARDFDTQLDVLLSFQNDLTLTIGPATVVNVDGHPELATANTDYISVGQQVDMEVLPVLDANSKPVLDANNLPTWSAANGLVRLIPTTGWAVQNSAGAGDISANLVTLGGFEPGTLNLTGTNSTPTAYTVGTGALDVSGLAANPVFRFDGLVTPFGMAPPDFVADSVATATATDQVMTVQWTGGTVSPLISKDANGLVVNITGATGGFVTPPVVQTGPLYIQDARTTFDLAANAVNPTIVADPALHGQFTIGNPTSTTGLAAYHDYSSFLSALGTVLNGTNTVLTLVAVGHYDTTSNQFTAYRIDMVQSP